MGDVPGIRMPGPGLSVEPGFARSTTAVVARMAGVSKRTIYETFAGETELFATVIRKRQSLILDLPWPADEDLSLHETLEKIFHLDLDPAVAREREAILNLVVRESVLFPRTLRLPLQARDHPFARSPA